MTIQEFFQEFVGASSIEIEGEDIRVWFKQDKESRSCLIDANMEFDQWSKALIECSEELMEDRSEFDFEYGR